MSPSDFERTEAQLLWERRARELLQRIAVAAASSASWQHAMQTALDEVCRTTGWPIGHVLVRDETGHLVTTRIWRLEDPSRFAEFREISDRTRFPPGVGLPGRVLSSGKPHWIMDVTRDSNFPRAREVRDIGVRAGLGFPVCIGDEVFAVLEFFAPEAHEPDEPLLEVMQTIGMQLGRVVERGQAEAALRQSELRFRAVAQSAHDAIISADGDGKIVFWNSAAETMLGYSVEEAIGQPLSIVIPEHHRAGHQAGIARVRAGGERHVIGRTVELEALRRDGTEFPIELSLATWTIGEAVYYTGILRDITDRRVAEERLRTAAERLERSQRQAVEASRAKSIFLANMSHELRTPLNAILGFVQLMERDPSLGAEQRENLKVILRSGEHLLGLINDVLSLSKIEAGESTLHAADFDLVHLLRSLRDMFQLRAQARGLELVFDQGGDLPKCVHGDEGKLRQVLINLLGNAVKFTDTGGVALRVRWLDGRAAFEVKDTGPGIAPDDAARLFRPFVQADSGLRTHEGTGLGLAISSHFVRLMGGELRLASEPGQGACFSFEVDLPVAEQPDRTAERRCVIGLGLGQPERRILVVDNDPDNRRMLSQLLASVGLRTREAHNGREAVEAWRAWRPDLIWMDMRMPVMSGYEATLAIRRLEATEGAGRTVIVALTASAFEHDRAPILEAGCDDVVAKPFRESDIFGTLERLIGVRFAYELRAQPAETVLAAGAPVELGTDRLAALPPEWLRDLERTLGEGDDRAAHQVVDLIAGRDEPLARELGRMIKGFQFDELLGLVERARR